MHSLMIVLRRAGRACALLIIFLLGTSSAQAADLLVPSQYTTIQAAINAAAPGDTVLLADGSYTGTGNKNLNFGGKDITVRSASGNSGSCIISCEASGRGFIFQSGETAAARVADITITNGSITGFNEGGGIYINNSSPTITNCYFVGNRTEFSGGGGMYIANGNPTITNCTFQENDAGNGRGGGMYLYQSNATITGCDFFQNQANYGCGGVYMNNSNPTVTDCNFFQNQAILNGGAGGGMSLIVSNPTVTNCYFGGNKSAGPGGGIYCQVSSPTLTGCTLEYNQGSTGGGIAFYGSTPTLSRGTFRGNSSRLGGGIFLFQCGNAIITQSAFLGNTGVDGGGGMGLYQSNLTLANASFVQNVSLTGGGMSLVTSNPTITNCTLTANWGISSVGGIYNETGSSPTITNSILWGNIGGEIGNDPQSSSTIAYSDVQGGLPAGTNDGGGNINANPHFTEYPSPGGDGITGTFDDYPGNLQLQYPSPCLNVGSNAALPIGITTDLDGKPRIVYGTVDMGAYETQVALEVTAQVQITWSGFRRNATTGRYIQTVTLRNLGKAGISGPISLVLDSLSSNASLFNKTGTTIATSPSGSPYINTTGSLSSRGSATLTLEFTNPTNGAITYTTRVLAGTGVR